MKYKYQKRAKPAGGRRARRRDGREVAAGRVPETGARPTASWEKSRRRCCQQSGCLPDARAVGHAARASPCRIGPTASRSLRVRPAGLTVFTHAGRPRAIAIDGRSIFATPRPPWRPGRRAFAATAAWTCRRVGPVRPRASPGPGTGPKGPGCRAPHYR